MKQLHTFRNVTGLILVLFLSSCTTENPNLTTKQARNSSLKAEMDSIRPENDIRDSTWTQSNWSELPLLESPLQLVRHKAYTLGYNERYEQAAWVAYVLTAAETKSNYKRSNDFEVDPKVSTGTATNNDYSHSGYDRGHLAPAADMSFSWLAMNESFYYSNMSPQEPSFNRGIWKNLEELMRNWAVNYDSIYVVTGPVFEKNMSFIGTNKVAVPGAYYKVIVKRIGNKVEGIGFILPNRGSNVPLQSFVVSIDQVEQRTGIDFFSSWQDGIESAMEKQACISCWNWYQPHGCRSNSNASSSSAESVQCAGMTKKGSRCKRMTKDPSGYCYQHHP
jgi:endonuclease G